MNQITALKSKKIMHVLQGDLKRKVKKLSVIKYNEKDYCYTILSKVSRSFAMVIQDLPEELRDATCIYYLVLRALDTIEDDMNLPAKEKHNLLTSFHLSCGDESYSLDNVGDHPDYVDLLRNYPKVSKVFNQLSKAYQIIIAQSTQEMAEGMLKYANKDVVSKADYDEYCYYVAGLVGKGLSDLFIASGLESNEELVKNNKWAISMGLFLQKTNITRDFYEDIDEERIFWPEEIWLNYTDDLTTFKTNNQSAKSIACLNKMVENALHHFQDCIVYLNLLENQKVFRFCAIPQVMALATLSLLFNNENTFVENVKVDKSTTMDIFSKLQTMNDFKQYALQFINQFQLKEADVTIEVMLEDIKSKLN